MIKVGIIGTHGTRKTSICYDLAGKLKAIGINAGVMEEVARNLPRFPPRFDINERTTLESQAFILHSQVKGELEFWARGDVNPLLTDRTVIDNHVYPIYRFGKDKIDPAYDAFVTYWTRTYDLLFKLPILKNKSMIDDPTRAVSDDFQVGIDRLLEEELREREIPFVRYTTPEDAIGRIMVLLDEERR